MSRRSIKQKNIILEVKEISKPDPLMVFITQTLKLVTRSWISEVGYLHPCLIKDTRVYSNWNRPLYFLFDDVYYPLTPDELCHKYQSVLVPLFKKWYANISCIKRRTMETPIDSMIHMIHFSIQCGEIQVSDIPKTSGWFKDSEYGFYANMDNPCVFNYNHPFVFHDCVYYISEYISKTDIQNYYMGLYVSHDKNIGILITSYL